MPDPAVAAWAILAAVIFVGYMLIAFVLYRGKIATLGKRTFYLYSTVYAGIEVVGFGLLFLGLKFFEQDSRSAGIDLSELLSSALVAVAYVMVLTALKKLPYIREVLESLKAPLLDPIPKQGSELLEKGHASSP
ncbi:hypothetical protein [Aquidulcibacter sp.]|uniref:hypothetical protein n=1 Tax=Aquidulcibacter sp. TaxID=2052990 RepID=UPI0025BFD743|nr:hypothetical protein [Aquidulcibacter sp.]MCA3697210.1 hypothetical protein [Aquidulcibacter sp.]